MLILFDSKGRQKLQEINGPSDNQKPLATKSFIADHPYFELYLAASW